MIPAWFTWQAVTGVFGSLWSGLCSLISTPVGAALIAATLAYNTGVHVERGRLNAEWQAKWHDAEISAEHARLVRDAFMKVQMSEDANRRIGDLTDAKSILEQKLKDYEYEEANRQPTVDAKGVATCRCLTTRADDEWLHAAREAITKPEARRGLAERLRAGSR